MIDKLPPGYEEKFSDLTHELFYDISQLIEKYRKDFNEKNEEIAMPCTIAINALSRMISVLILQIPKEDVIYRQGIITYFQELAHKAIDGNLKVMMKIREDT